MTPEELADFERYLEHSLTLNTVAFRLARALGDVPEGQEWAEGDPVELADRMIAERDKAREKLHIPTLAQASTPGVWNVYCVACSDAAQDYVQVCTAGRWTVPAQLVAYDLLVQARGDAVDAVQMVADLASGGFTSGSVGRTCGRSQTEGWCPEHGYGMPPGEMCLCDLTYPGVPGAVEVHPDADCPIHGESTSDGGSGS